MGAYDEVSKASGNTLTGRQFRRRCRASRTDSLREQGGKPSMGNFRYRLSGPARWSHAGDMLCVAALLWLGLAQAQSAVVTDKLISGSSRTQPDVPVTFGQVFKK